MALRIIWSPIALANYENIIAFLVEKWTIKEIRNLNAKIEATLTLIKDNPKLFPKATSDLTIHKARIDLNNYIVYSYSFETQILEIINFRSTRQKPLQ
jgi:plasmid stabilization system protein ParE